MAILLPMPCFVAAVLLVRTDTANAAHAGIGVGPCQELLYFPGRFATSIMAGRGNTGKLTDRAMMVKGFLERVSLGAAASLKKLAEKAPDSATTMEATRLEGGGITHPESLLLRWMGGRCSAELADPGVREPSTGYLG
ncbi:unnamed protein product, partial [Symbiodinium sp. KB8]